VAILAGIAIPPVHAALTRSKTAAAARYLGGRMAMARTYAVSRSANVALRFIRTRSDTTIQMFVDGNGNGVRTADIASRVDLPLDRPVRLSELFSNVAIGAADGGDPIRIGNTNLMSFTPIGTATPGTIFVRGDDGSQMSVRVFGATGRTRVLRYDPKSGEWVDTF
jgi:Tfp pilus assembly protein FimT